jgi:hypothetical protein
LLHYVQLRIAVFRILSLKRFPFRAPFTGSHLNLEIGKLSSPIVWPIFRKLSILPVDSSLVNLILLTVRLREDSQQNYFDWWKGRVLSQPGLPLFVGKTNPPEVEPGKRVSFVCTAQVRTKIIDVVLYKHSGLRTIKRVIAYL